MKKPKPRETCAIEFAPDGMLYVIFDGQRIARGGPRQRWVSLAPGYTVRGAEPGNYDGFEVIEHRLRKTTDAVDL